VSGDGVFLNDLAEESKLLLKTSNGGGIGGLSYLGGEFKPLLPEFQFAASSSVRALAEVALRSWLQDRIAGIKVPTRPKAPAINPF
jgi:hypothetical protein